MSLDFQAIIAGGKRSRIATVDIPELGGPVCLHAMRSVRKDAFDRACSATDGRVPDNWRAMLVAHCLCDIDGKPLCDDPAASACELGEIDAAIMATLYDAAAKLNGLRNKDLEQAEKNS